MTLQDREMGRDTAFLTVFSVLSQLLGFGYRVVLSRMVGAQVMGLYQLVMPVYSVLMSLTAVGLTAAVSNLTARYLALGDGAAVARTVRLCIGLLLGMMVPVGLVTAALYDPISVYLLGDARTQLGLLLLLPCVALTGVENIHKHFFYGAGQVRLPAVVELLEQFIRTGAVLGLLVLFLPQNPERTVGLIVTGMILCEVFSSVTLVLLCRSRLGGRRAGAKPPHLCRRVITVALPVGLTALLGNLMGAVNAALIPQRLVAGGMEPERAMARFGVLCGMTMPMLALPTVFLGALNLVMVPRVTRSYALGNTAGVQENILRTLQTTAVLILPSMALMTVVGEDLGMLLYGEPTAGRYLLPLAVATACSCFQGVLCGGLNGTDHQSSAAGIALVCDVVQLALTALLMPSWGMDGFVAGVVISSVLGLVLCLLAVCRHTGMSLCLWRPLGLPALATLLCGQTARLLYRVLEQAGMGHLPRLCGVVAFGVLVYVSALCAMGIGRRGEKGGFPAHREKCR